MSESDKEFRRLADSFIHLANEYSDTVEHDRVAAALLYAAARYNAFVVSSKTRTRAQFSSEKEKAVAFFRGQYERMLRENLDDHEDNYEKFKG